ncbi:MAG: T9SS type A sorting domain-containing protein [Bacteroidota bacterium]
MLSPNTIYNTLLFFIFYTVSWSQSTPVFEAKIFIEDAIGNRDTITIGHDPQATEWMDAEFGEKEITTPFDSVFEVRAASFERPEILSKRIITWSEEIIGLEPCRDGDDVFIYIYAKHQPIKVSWDNLAFYNNKCVQSALMTNHWSDALVFPYDWDLNPMATYYCMAIEDSFEIQTTPEALEGAGRLVSVEKEVIGKGMQTIYGIRYFGQPENGFSPCNDAILTSTEAHLTNTEHIEVFPNPVDNYLYLKGVAKGLEQIRIYDLSGRLKRLVSKPLDGMVDVSQLLSGLYTISFEYQNGRLEVRKFLKI